MLVPFTRVRLETTKDPAQVREALRSSIDGDVGFLPWMAPWTGRHLAGTVTDSWFRLTSRTRSRQFFLPVTEGVIRAEGPKTILEATVRPKLTEVAIFVIAVVVMTVATLVNGHSLWGVAVIGLIIYGAGYLGFSGATERVLRTLKASIQDVPQSK
jgi:hypothetical protein